MSSGASDPPRRRARSLAFRINAWYAIVFVATLAAIVAIAAAAARGAILREDALVVEARVEQHAALLVAAGLPAYRRAVEDAARLDGDTPPVRVRDATGATIFEHGDVGASLYTASRATGQLRIELGSTRTSWDAIVDRLAPGLVALAVATALLGLAGGWYLTRRGLAPIRALAAAARDVSVSGELSRRVPERDTGDELAELTVLFNRMLDRNERLVRGMRDALDDVAHDLRTPLTRLRGGAEIALRDPDPAAAREALADCIEESDRVLVLLRGLMDISEAETGIMRLDRADVALARVAEDAIELYAHVAEEAGVALALAPGADAPVVHADAARLRQAIANLIDNAIKYTPRGGQITVEVAREGGEGVVRVRDTGEGVPPEALPRIWDRLYRADPSRSRQGLGLGLSLVRAIVAAHGGRVDVASEPGAGSSFVIALPVRAWPAPATVAP